MVGFDAFPSNFLCSYWDFDTVKYGKGVVSHTSVAVELAYLYVEEVRYGVYCAFMEVKWSDLILRKP